MNGPKLFRKETRPLDCWDWTTPEDVVRHALAAYYYACRNAKPPEGQRFIDGDGLQWTDRAGWAETLCDFLELRVKTDAYRLGIGDFGNEARRLSRCEHPGQHLAGVAP